MWSYIFWIVIVTSYYVYLIWAFDYDFNNLHFNSSHALCAFTHAGVLFSSELLSCRLLTWLLDHPMNNCYLIVCMIVQCTNGSSKRTPDRSQRQDITLEAWNSLWFQYRTCISVEIYASHWPNAAFNITSCYQYMLDTLDDLCTTWYESNTTYY